MEDASLDEFLSGGDDASNSADTDDDAEAGDGADTGSDADASDSVDTGGDAEGGDSADTGGDDSAETRNHDVEPAKTTGRWAADGVVCASCGERVSRCWQSPDGLVCPDCKKW